MKKYLLGTLTLALVLAGGWTLASGQNDQSASQDMRDAGHSTKRAAKKTGHKVKKTVKKGAHKSAKKVDQGARKVEEKTEPQP